MTSWLWAKRLTFCIIPSLCKASILKNCIFKNWKMFIEAKCPIFPKFMLEYWVQFAWLTLKVNRWLSSAMYLGFLHHSFQKGPYFNDMCLCSTLIFGDLFSTFSFLIVHWWVQNRGLMTYLLIAVTSFLHCLIMVCPYRTTKLPCLLNKSNQMKSLFFSSLMTLFYFDTGIWEHTC